MEMLKYAKKLKITSENPNLSHEHISNTDAKLMGVNIELNSLGHRSKDISKKKNKDEYRVHVIGSSMTLGWGVEKEKIFTSILEKKLNKNEFIKKSYKDIKVINAGIGNTNTQHHYYLFKDQYELTKPDTLILQYFINDAEIIKKKKNNFIIRTSYFVAFLYQQILSLSFFGTLDNYYKDLYSDDSQGWLAVKDSVLRLKEISENNNINFIIMIIPDLHDFSDDNELIPLYTKIDDEFKKMNIPVLNTYNSLSNKFKNKPINSWVSKNDAHPNSKAHEIISTDLYSFIIKQNIF
ncbi:SGNH/GDSL hydrolase family protein [Candidatus Pelagibacter sp.]|nr:SGNH/GDSL hydrolase family protein [Candidatus Pelagibacter sp.]